MDEQDPPRRSGRGGRKRDPSRDRAIIDAAVDVLAEVGYEGFTMDLVAARAKAGKATLYRRWPSKGELIVDAVASIRGHLDVDDPPDTGSLRGDFAAAFVQQSPEESERLLRAMASLGSLISVDDVMAEAADATVVEPFVEVNRTLIRRAIARGEIAADVDVETIALVSPLMSAYRMMVQRQALDIDLLFRVIDLVVMPALQHPGRSTR